MQPIQSRLADNVRGEEYRELVLMIGSDVIYSLILAQENEQLKKRLANAEERLAKCEEFNWDLVGGRSAYVTE